MPRSPTDPRLLIGVLLFAVTAGVGPAAHARSGATAHRTAPAASARQHTAPAVAEDEDDDDAAAVLSRCERRAQGRLRTWDRMGDAAVSATRSVGHFLGASEASVSRVLRFGHSLSESVARRLDCHEQHQAEVATARAISGGVGTTSRWRSETRAHVNGSSTVVALEGRGTAACLTVTDVVIVDGEETRAAKRMCRRPPSNRYMRV